MTCQRSHGKDEGELGSWVKALGGCLSVSAHPASVPLVRQQGLHFPLGK